MDDYHWGRATWPELAELGLSGKRDEEPHPEGGVAPAGVAGSGAGVPVVALLPLGAVEAHGPHLPLITDVTIAVAAAEAATASIDALGARALVLPPLSYTPAGFAAGFPGTVSVRPDTVRALVLDIAESLEGQGVAALILVNAHLDPAHLGALHGVVDGYPGSMKVLFPDISRRPWATRMTAEFKSGACHGGQYETSVLMAADPGSVREAVRGTLPENPASLSDAIRRGMTSFEEAGVDRAYCGDPAAATADEGQETIRVLGGILTDALREEWS